MDKKIVYNDENHIVKRIGAYVIDVFIVFIIINVINKVLHINIQEMTLVEKIKNDLTNNIILALYTITCMKWLFKNQTVGKYFMKLKVVSKEGKELNGYQLLHREFITKLFIEKINLWIMFILLVTGIMNNLLEIIKVGWLEQCIYYLFNVPWVMIVSFSMMVNSSKHNTLHDCLSKTEVIQVTQ